MYKSVNLFETMNTEDTMSSLYKQLSGVYEAMYQSFINYEDEYLFYSHLLSTQSCKSLVEIGCGTGHLAGRFAETGFDYTGMDVSEDMLSIAKNRHPGVRFVQEDMRSFHLPEKTDAAIITGRTISYLLSNQDVYNALMSIHNNLTASGIICFDFIDANAFIPQLRAGKKIIHKASFNGKNYQRESVWKTNLAYSWAFDWQAVYYEEDKNGTWQQLGEDDSTIRAFTKDEMRLFLALTGFFVKQIIPRPSYAFDTFVIVAGKQEDNPSPTL
jgi:SAM-dependent methyltransferase